MAAAAGFASAAAPVSGAPEREGAVMVFHNPLSPPPRDREGVRRKAMDQFAVPRQPGATIHRELAAARAAVDANTAKLKALRLARDEIDREAAVLAAANAPAKKPRKPRIKPAA
jgi:hypothetical protein